MIFAQTIIGLLTILSVLGIRFYPSLTDNIERRKTVYLICGWSQPFLWPALFYTIGLPVGMTLLFIIMIFPFVCLYFWQVNWCPKCNFTPGLDYSDSCPGCGGPAVLPSRTSLFLYKKRADTSSFDTSTQYAGTKAIVISSDRSGIKVRLNGSPWQASPALENFNPVIGEQVIVQKLDGLILKILPDTSVG
jgi:hypothetical protein